jgi:hypothetical protein
MYLGVIASTEWVPFDLKRPDLLECLKVYAQEERNGGHPYTFNYKESQGHYINAQTALENYINSGTIPLSKWQTHAFRFL